MTSHGIKVLKVPWDEAEVKVKDPVKVVETLLYEAHSFNL